eukprot:scpid30719/ scgid14076/ 
MSSFPAVVDVKLCRTGASFAILLLVVTQFTLSPCVLSMPPASLSAQMEGRRPASASPSSCLRYLEHASAKLSPQGLDVSVACGSPVAESEAHKYSDELHASFAVRIDHLVSSGGIPTRAYLRFPINPLSCHTPVGRVEIEAAFSLQYPAGDVGRAKAGHTVLNTARFTIPARRQCSRPWFNQLLDVSLYRSIMAAMTSHDLDSTHLHVSLRKIMNSSAVTSPDTDAGWLFPSVQPDRLRPMIVLGFAMNGDAATHIRKRISLARQAHLASSEAAASADFTHRSQPNAHKARSRREAEDPTSESEQEQVCGHLDDFIIRSNELRVTMETNETIAHYKLPDRFAVIRIKTCAQAKKCRRLAERPEFVGLSPRLPGASMEMSDISIKPQCRPVAHSSRTVRLVLAATELDTEPIYKMEELKDISATDCACTLFA